MPQGAYKEVDSCDSEDESSFGATVEQQPKQVDYLAQLKMMHEWVNQQSTNYPQYSVKVQHEEN